MAWYASSDNCINQLSVPKAWRDQIVCGWDDVVRSIGIRLIADVNHLHRPCFLALDGYKGAQLKRLLDGLTTILVDAGIRVLSFNVNEVFRSRDDVNEILRDYERPEDPSFGRVFHGALEDLIDFKKVGEITARWKGLRETAEARQVVICHGLGAGMAIWRHCFDRVAYCDVTREQILVRAERNELLPVGEDTPRGFPWKRIYYAEYPMLNRHKKSLLKSADWYIDNARDDNPKLIPADVYHALITELSGRPLAFKVFYMPGTFGGHEFGKRFKVEGLPNTSWDFEISVGDNHLLVDVGSDCTLEIPFYNILWEQPLRLLGSYSSATYPDHFPIAIYMQDGYFAPGDKAEFKRTHMPHHLHPDTAYCRSHFGEPLGRYETYYIVRADEGACTMHGFKDTADIDGYIEAVKKSAETKREFDWRNYVYEHPSQTGELHQIPPGTVHGTGGRQIILEIDTNPSRESTEYSFYLYDYCRPTFNYQRHDFSGRPAKLQIEHGLAILRRNRRQSFMADQCRPRPTCVRQGADWREMSFPMYCNMPYQINRFEFHAKIEDDTRDMFHCLSLTLGRKVRIYAKRDPSNAIVLEDCDSIVLPACFGEYICENRGEGPCEIIKTFLITQPRDYIGEGQEEIDLARQRETSPHSGE
jgi:hypothetical protein